MDRFIGRRELIDVLAEAMKAAFEAKPDTCRLALIHGEPGAGKTFLLQQFSELAKAWVLQSGMELWVGKGSCSDIINDSTSFLPFFQVLDALRTQPTSARSARLHQVDRIIAEFGPEWLRMLPVVGEGLAGTAQAVNRLRERQQLNYHFSPTAQADTDIYRQYYEVLERFAGDHRILVLLDDFQWADQESINLLLFLGRQLNASSFPIFLVCALRPGQGKLSGGSTASVETAVHLLGERKHCLQLHIKPFSRQETRLFLTSFQHPAVTRSSTLVSEELLDSMNRLTGGNPLFLSELLHNLEDKGYLLSTGEGLALSHPIEQIPDLPTSLEATIQERVDRLEDKFRELLTTASVEGDTFTAQVLSQVRKKELLDVIEMLSDTLVQKHHLVQEVEEKEITYHKFISLFAFRHGLIRQHLYRTLGTAQKRLLHKEIADSLEGLYGRDQIRPLASQLAKHYLIAREPLKVVNYGLMAAQEEYAKFAVTHALSWCERVIDAFHNIPLPTDDAQRDYLETLFLKTEIHLHLGQERLARESIARIEKDYDTALEPFDIARLHFLKGEIYEAEADLESAVNEYVLCKPLLRSTQHSSLEALASQRLGELSAISSDFDTAEKYWMEGIEQARGAKDELMEAMIWAEVAEFAIDEGDLDKSDAATARAMPLFRKLNARRGTGIALINVGFADFVRGKIGRALASLRTAWEIFQEVEDVPNMIRIGHHIANCYLRRGELDNAEAILGELQNFCSERQARLREVEYLITKGRLALARQQLEEAELFANLAVEVAVEGDHYSWPRAYSVKASVLSARADYRSAEHFFRLALDHTQSSNYPYVRALVQLEFGKFLAERGHLDEARELLQNAEESSMRLGAENLIFDVRQVLKATTSFSSS